MGRESKVRERKGEEKERKVMNLQWKLKAGENRTRINWKKRQSQT